MGEWSMSLKGAAYIAGAWEHPTRKAPDKSIALLHAECAKGALADAGLTKDDVDGYFCAGDAPGGLGPLSMVEYMNLKCRHVDSTDVGGSSEVVCAPEAGTIIRERSADAIATALQNLFADPPDRAATRLHAERFSWDETTRGQEQLFMALPASSKALQWSDAKP